MKRKRAKISAMIFVFLTLCMFLGTNAWAEVDSTNPADKAAGVSVNTTVTATFHEEMDSSTLNTDTFVITAGKGYGAQTVAGTVTYSETVATFTPSDALEYNQTYYVTLTTDIKDAAGNALPAEYKWSFTTESNMPSLITSTDPDDKADDADVNAGIVISFAQEMDASTISPGSFYLKIGTGYNLTSVPGTVSYSDMKATFTPDSPLDYKTAYTATVTDDVKDANGNPLENDYIWTFATKDQSTPTNPEISSVSPADQAENVSADTVVTVKFSEAMNSSTLEQAFSLGGGDVAVTMAYDENSNTATFTPTASLDTETSYAAVVTTDAKSVAGYSLKEDYTWSFTTGQVVVTIPKVTSTTPNNEAAGVLVNKPVSATFSKPMDCSTINDTTFTLGDASGAIAGTVDCSNTTATFTPGADLAFETSYTATITTGAKDNSGNSLEADHVWTFTTAEEGVIPPEVTSATMGNKIIIDFSRAMDPSTINNGTVVIKAVIPGIGYGTVSGVLEYDGTTATFTPHSDFVSSLSYSVTVTTGAKDTDGNSLGDDYDKKFEETVQGLEDLITLDALMARLEHLEDISKSYENHRASGTAGYNAAVEYVKDVLDETDYVITEQAVEFRTFEETEDAVMEQTSPNQVTYELCKAPEDDDPVGDFVTFTYSGTGDVTADIAFVTPTIPMPADSDPNTSNDGCEAEDFEGIDLNGKIALIQRGGRGECDFAAKAQNAENAGALGVIIFNEGQETRKGVMNANLGEGSEVTVPVLFTTYDLGATLYELSQAGAVTMHMSVTAVDEERTANNLLAETPGGNSDQVIMVGAHLDSVAEAPGTNDNGSGSVAILELAYQMAKHDFDPANKVRFAWWAVEEEGIIGSKAYLDSLSDEERSEIGMYLNFDMIGSNNYAIFVYDGDISDTADDINFDFDPEDIPAGCDEIEDAFLDYYGSEGLAAYPGVLNGRSDYKSFLDVGIPIGGGDAGGDGLKTEEQVQAYGGTAGEQYDSCYHQLCDNAENLNKDALIRISKAAAHVTQLFAEKATLFTDKGERRSAKGERVRDRVFKYDRYHSERHLYSVR